MTKPRWLNEAFGLRFSQREVDFVVPRLDADLPLCIDPFLLYKNRREELRDAHAVLLGMFNRAFELFRSDRTTDISYLIDFPEVPDIRFGYSAGGTRGSGMGKGLRNIVAEVMRSSPALIDRGLRHVEELQLFSYGIAEDRISDLTANVLRGFLINYTQRQAHLWDIPLESGVPQEHVWDDEEQSWADGYYDLPVDPQSGLPILLVPRWIVRRLPWINFPDYLRVDLRRFLQPVARSEGRHPRISKDRAVWVTRQNLTLVDNYVDRKERNAASAKPYLPAVLRDAPDTVCSDLLDRLKTLPTGLLHAQEYQRLSLAILNCLLEPELTDGEPQVRTASGTEIRDLVYRNNSDIRFLDFLANTHGNLLIVFECKNVQSVDQDDVNQLANYLGDPMGYCGFLLCRRPPSDGIMAKVRATYNKGNPRRVVVIISDDDVMRMVMLKRNARDHPVAHLQRKYRELMQSME